MVVGIDDGSEKYYFRAFNWRGIEVTRKPVPFSNSMESGKLENLWVDLPSIIEKEMEPFKGIPVY